MTDFYDIYRKTLYAEDIPIRYAVEQVCTFEEWLVLVIGWYALRSKDSGDGGRNLRHITEYVVDVMPKRLLSPTSNWENVASLWRCSDRYESYDKLPELLVVIQRMWRPKS